MTLKKTNVLFISPSTSVKGGITTVIKGYLDSKLSKDYNIYTISSHIDGNKLNKSFCAISGLFLTLFYMIFKQIDIVHIHGSDTTSSLRKYMYFKIVEIFSCKVIYHFHGASFLELYHEKSEGWKKRISYLFEHVNLVICLSKDWERKINVLFPKARTVVVENAVTMPEEYEKSQMADRKGINLLFLGLIGERKGIFDLLKVVKRLKEAKYNIKLSVGGNGNVGGLLKEISALELEDSVEYLGWIDTEKKETIFQESDIYILPSYGEGMPMSILEAMSYGLPVISTNVGGIPDLVIDEKTGILIEPGDKASLFTAIEKLSLNATLRFQMGRNCRNLILEKYNLDSNILKIDNIYKKLLNL